MAEVGILIVDDDIASQRALKNVLDSEGWRVRIVPLAAHALAELATGAWNLVIVNVALADLRGPLFAILKELSRRKPGRGGPKSPQRQHGRSQPSGSEGAASPKASFACSSWCPLLARKADLSPSSNARAFPIRSSRTILHDFLEKVSELLVEAGAIAEPIRSIGGFGAGRKVRRRNRHVSRDSRRGTMFASREDYQMTDEEMAEYEREEEEDRKKREKRTSTNMKDPASGATPSLSSSRTPPERVACSVRVSAALARSDPLRTPSRH